MKVHYKRRMTGTIALMASLLFLCIQVARGETGKVTEFKINEGAVTITASGDYLITGTGEEISNTITVDASSSNEKTPVNITIRGVKIKADAPFSIKGYVNLTVEGENSFVATDFAGIQVETGNTLIITESSTGSVEATGDMYAGIGGGYRGSGGSITINGGTVTATGGRDGSAGIGGGQGGSGGFITINGGTVTATGGSDSSAGIGGGKRGSGGFITINGGKVTAKATDSGAGIGGGQKDYSSEGNGGTITITGGTVIAMGETGIGGGSGGNRGNITIEGGTVTATGSAGAGIGGGNGAGDKITITGGTVTATGGSWGAGIGGDGNSSGGFITISGGIVTAKGGAGYGHAAAGIGSGLISYSDETVDGGTITISGGTVTAEGGAEGAAGIGLGKVSGGNSGTPGTFSTGASSGNAFIIASSISDDTDSDWSGAIIVGTSGKVYGNPTLTTDAVIPKDKTLTVESGHTLEFGKDVTLAVDDGGTLTNKGTVSGTVLRIEDKGTVNGTSSTTTAIGYKVTYDANDGSGRIETDYVTSTSLNNEIFKRSYYTFKEWRDAAGASEGSPVTTISASSKVYYAQWTTVPFTLVPATNPTVTITYGESISYDLAQFLPEDMTEKTGGVSSYAFKDTPSAGWSLNGSTVSCTKPDATEGKEVTFTITARNTATAEATVTFVVNKATPIADHFNYAALASLTYDKTAKTATVVANEGIEGMGKVTPSYYKDEKKVDEAIAAGTYTVKINVAEGTNYTAITGDLTVNAWTFTITPKTLTLTPTEDQILYKGEVPTYTSIDDQILQSDNVTVEGNLTVEDSKIKGGVTLAGTDAANYKLVVTETSCEYTDKLPSAVEIDPASLTGVWHKAVVTLTAPKGFLIGLAEAGAFSTSVDYDTEGTSCTYYLQRANAGQTVYSHTVAIQIDKTAPEITETKIDGLSYAITISDATSGIASVTLDGESLTAEATDNTPAPASSTDVKVYKGACTKGGNYSLVVTDVAGNETTQVLHFDDPTPPTPPTPPDPGTEPDPNPGTEPDPTYYTVTLPAIEGATTDPVAGSYEVESWSNFRFSLTLAKGYDQSQPVVTTSNGGEIKPRTSDGAYIVSVRNDMEIYIDGIVKNPDPVGNETIDTGGIKIWAARGYLHIQTPQPEQACIFTPDGRLLKALRIPAEGQRIALPKGFYLVRLADQCVKVVL